MNARRVLVVEDEESLRIVLGVNLPLSGYDVVEAENAESALALAREQDFDVFLLDVMMPPTSGFELAKRLRADPATASVPIVFISGRADRADVEEGLELGAADYITKPFDPVELGARLDRLLDGDGDEDGAEP